MQEKSYAIPKIQAAYDYKVFNILDRNRVINSAHVKQLAKDIDEHGQQIPIIVNENMDVIDGQHRLAALSSLGYPVLYYMTKGTDVEDVGRLNSLQAKWGEKDWVHDYAEGGSKSYKLIEKCKEKYKDLSFRTIVYAFKCGNYSSSSIRSGKLDISKEESVAGKEALKYLAKFGKCMDSVPGSTRAFCFAILWCAHHGDRIDLDRLQKRVCKDMKYAKGYARVQDWVSWFEETVNKYCGEYQSFCQIFKKESYESKHKSRPAKKNVAPTKAEAKKTEAPKYRKPVRRVHTFDADLFRDILGKNAKVLSLDEIQKAS